MTLRTNISSRKWFLLALCVIAAITVKATLSAPSPEAVIEQTSQQMIEALRDNRETIDTDPDNIYALIDRIAVPHFDIETIVRLVLGVSWRRATNDQRQAFQKEFQTLVRNTYARAMLQYTDETVRVLPVPPESLKSKRVHVRSLIEGKYIETVSIVYRMHMKAGSWKIYDFTIEGVSLVLNYRQSFAEQIKRDGLDALILSLSEKNAAFELYNDEKSTPE